MSIEGYTTESDKDKKEVGASLERHISLSSDEVRNEVSALLRDSVEIESLDVAGQGDAFRIDACFKHSFAGDCEIKATIGTDGDVVSVRDFEVIRAGFGRKGLVENAINSQLSKLPGKLKSILSEKYKKEVRTTRIENGELQVEFVVDEEEAVDPALDDRGNYSPEEVSNDAEVDGIDEQKLRELREHMDARFNGPEDRSSAIDTIERQLQQDGVAKSRDSLTQLSNEGRAVGLGLLRSLAEEFRTEFQDSSNGSKKIRDSIVPKFAARYSQLRQELEETYGLDNSKDESEEVSADNEESIWKLKQELDVLEKSEAVLITFLEDLRSSGSEEIEIPGTNKKYNESQLMALISRAQKQIADNTRNLGYTFDTSKIETGFVGGLHKATKDSETVELLSDELEKIVIEMIENPEIAIEDITKYMNAFASKNDLRGEEGLFYDNMSRVRSFLVVYSEASEEEKAELLPKIRKEVQESYDLKSRLNVTLEDPNGATNEQEVISEESPEFAEGSLSELWKDLNKDERSERREELRQKIQELRNARANLAILENSSLFRRIFRGRSTHQELTEARERYENLRAEYVGDKVSRVLADRTRLAREQAKEHAGGPIFEKLRENWRAMGEVNLDSWMTKHGRRPKSKVGKVFARMASLRTATSLALLGVGVAAGGGALVGTVAIATRRAWGGLGTAFGSYDLLRQVSEKRRLAFNAEKIGEIETGEIEELMASYEATAKFSGEGVVKSEDYNSLRAEYRRRVEDADGNVSDALERLDSVLREQQQDVGKVEARSKIAAVGIGTLFSTAGVTVLNRLFSGGFGEEAQAVAREVFDESAGLEHAQEVVANAPLFSVEDIDQSYKACFEEIEYLTEDTGEIISTIKHGGSAWAAMQELVDNGALSQEDAYSAWSSTASTMELPSGQSVHISDLHLTHEGDQLVFIPYEGDIPAHFDVVDYTDNELHVGTAKDLKVVYDELGKEAPKWLDQAVSAEEISKIIDKSAESVSLDGGPDYGSIVEQLELEGLEVSPELRELAEMPRIAPESPVKIEGVETLFEPESGDVDSIKFTDNILSNEEIIAAAEAGNLVEMTKEIHVPGGSTATIVTDKEGRVVDIILKETGASNTVETERAVTEYLAPEYQENITDAIEDPRMRMHAIAEARDYAWRMHNYRGLYNYDYTPYNSQPSFGEIMRHNIKENMIHDVGHLVRGVLHRTTHDLLGGVIRNPHIPGYRYMGHYYHH